MNSALREQTIACKEVAASWTSSVARGLRKKRAQRMAITVQSPSRRSRSTAPRNSPI